MAINFDKALGVHQYSVGVRERRAEVLASNIANADTPGFKAKDLSFKDALASATQGRGFNLSKTSEHHISGFKDVGTDLQFRIPNQPDTGDGNTVDVQTERASFMQNSMEYQASLSFLSSKIQTMRKAIKGE
ncbi:MAG: flagellar basal-body rod protein FlgB [Moritella sp.]|jgi:flagellar basal-body rod protein FlgB